jgi:hypothetical protein
MIRSNIISGLILFAILALNALTILSVNKRYSSTLNENLVSQSQLSGEHMETTLLQFSSDINQELRQYSDSEIFADPEKFQEATRSLRLFYSKYRDLITKISIYDNKKNFYALYFDADDDFGKADRFVVDSFAMRKQARLYPRDRVEQDGSVFKYFYPYFGQDVVNGNVVVEVDIRKFAEEVFYLYPKGQNLNLQWVLDAEGQIILDNFQDDSLKTFQRDEGKGIHGLLPDKYLRPEDGCHVHH